MCISSLSTKSPMRVYSANVCERITHKACVSIYLHLQKVVQLLTRGREGLGGAELKVPQLVLCSGKHRHGVTCKGTRRKQESILPSYIKNQSLSNERVFLFCSPFLTSRSDESLHKYSYRRGNYYYLVVWLKLLSKAVQIFLLLDTCHE